MLPFIFQRGVITTGDLRTQGFEVDGQGTWQIAARSPPLLFVIAEHCDPRAS